VEPLVFTEFVHYVSTRAMVSVLLIIALVVCCFAYYVKDSLSADPVPSTWYRVPGTEYSVARPAG